MRLLTPLLRFKRDGRRFAAAARARDWSRLEPAYFQPTSRLDLLDAHDQGRIFDPAGENFIARRRLRRQVGDLKYTSSDYLYSEHQLIAAPLVRAALPRLSYGGPGGAVDGIDLPPDALRSWQSRSAGLREIVIAATALEPRYYPNIVGRIRWNGNELDEYDRWVGELPAEEELRWLQVEPAWFKDAAASLLEESDAIDPLGRWAQVVRAARPETWKLLKGEARSAVDLRIRAEILLRYYELLARERRAPALDQGEERRPSVFASRLGRPPPRDPILTEFGLSPHPRVLLVLEGETEMLLFPRVMAYFELRQDREFIAIENAQGVGRDLSALVAYAVAPQVERAEHGRYLELLRPPTRLMVMMDPEGPHETQVLREKRKEQWIQRVMETLPPEDRTATVRHSVSDLVTVDTWDRHGQSFEFAHFTDLQIARAVVAVDRRQRPARVAPLRAAIGSIRRDRGNLDRVLSHVSKPKLAEALWPVLERKLRRADAAKRAERIPIVRAVDRATDLARQPAGKIVIPLNEP